MPAETLHETSQPSNLGVASAESELPLDTLDPVFLEPPVLPEGSIEDDASLASSIEPSGLEIYQDALSGLDEKLAGAAPSELEQDPEKAELLAKISALESKVAALEDLDYKRFRVLTDDQPRRVRDEGGKIEHLVKYSYNDEDRFEWEEGPANKQTGIQPDMPSPQDGNETGNPPEAPIGTEPTVGAGPEANQNSGGNSGESGDEKGDEGGAEEAPAGAEEAPGTEEAPAGTEKAGPEADEPGDESTGAPGNETSPAPGKELEPFKSKEVELFTYQPEISPELSEALEESQDKYAQLTAKHRQSIIGHFLHNSKYIARIPGVKALADFINRSDDADLTEARDGYKQAVHDIQSEIMNQIRIELGESDSSRRQIMQLAGDVAIQSQMKLEYKIASERMSRSGKSNRFIDWWVSQDTLGKKLKKAGLIAGAGLAIGVIAGLGGAPLIGVALASGGAAGTGLYINKKRAGAVAPRGNGADTIAQTQSVADTASYQEYSSSQREAGKLVGIDDLTDITEKRTGEEKAGNRRRVKAMFGAAAAGASAGAAIGSTIRGAINNAAATQARAGSSQSSNSASTDPGEHLRGNKPYTLEQQPAPQPTPETLNGTTFNVEPGSGYTRELMQFAQANGHNLSPNQSWQLHQALTNRFGGDYIDIAGRAQDVYSMGPSQYSVGLSAPGKANWDPGVAEFIKDWMSSQGLWQ